MSPRHAIERGFRKEVIRKAARRARRVHGKQRRCRKCGVEGTSKDSPQGVYWVADDCCNRCARQ